MAHQNSHFQQSTMVRTFSLVGWLFDWHLLLFYYLSWLGFAFRSCWNHHLINTVPSWFWDLFCPLFACTWTSRCKNSISASYAYCRESACLHVTGRNLLWLHTQSVFILVYESEYIKSVIELLYVLNSCDF